MESVAILYDMRNTQSMDGWLHASKGWQMRKNKAHTTVKGFKLSSHQKLCAEVCTRCSHANYVVALLSQTQDNRPLASIILGTDTRRTICTDIEIHGQFSRGRKAWGQGLNVCKLHHGTQRIACSTRCFPNEPPQQQQKKRSRSINNRSSIT